MQQRCSTSSPHGLRPCAAEGSTTQSILDGKHFTRPISTKHDKKSQGRNHHGSRSWLELSRCFGSATLRRIRRCLRFHRQGTHLINRKLKSARPSAATEPSYARKCGDLNLVRAINAHAIPTAKARFPIRTKNGATSPSARDLAAALL